MSETISTKISRKLAPGAEIKNYSTQEKGVTVGGVFIFDPLSNVTITWNDTQGTNGHFYANILAALRRAGVLVEPTRSSDTSRRSARIVSHKEPKNAVIIAEETLRDFTASPRERALARNYLELMTAHNSVRELARRLGRRLKELEKLID